MSVSLAEVHRLPCRVSEQKGLLFVMLEEKTIVLGAELEYELLSKYTNFQSLVEASKVFRETARTVRQMKCCLSLCSKKKQ